MSVVFYLLSLYRENKDSNHIIYIRYEKRIIDSIDVGGNRWLGIGTAR